MDTERFEALIDAILAIIITIIVMEIPLPETTSLTSLIELYPEFIAYALSFMICFSVWNYHHNLYSIVNKLNSRITWCSGISIMFVGLLPHVTTMIATDFYSFTAQAMFGLLFFIVMLSSYITDELLMKYDKANIALRVALENRKKITLFSTVMLLIGCIIGYFVYTPAISIASLLTIIVNYIPKDVLKKIKLF